LAKNKLIICQSNAAEADIKAELFKFSDLKKYKELVVINPLGYWTGGTNVDTGCTNRKLGSDLAGSITGGGINGKDLSKADVSVTIYCWLMAQALQKEITAYCSIGAKKVIVNGEPISFSKIVTIAKDYIAEIGGFEELSKYGLISPIG